MTTLPLCLRGSHSPKILKLSIKKAFTFAIPKIAEVAKLVDALL